MVSDKEIVNVKWYKVDIPFEDFGMGRLFVISNEFGPCFVSRNLNMCDAHEDYLDHANPIEEDELLEAYSVFDTMADWLCQKNQIDRNNRSEWLRVCKFIDAWKEDFFQFMVKSDDYDMELCEGYQYQPNASGTGVVWEGHHLHISEVEECGLPEGLSIEWESECLT